MRHLAPTPPKVNFGFHFCPRLPQFCKQKSVGAILRRHCAIDSRFRRNVAPALRNHFMFSAQSIHVLGAMLRQRCAIDSRFRRNVASTLCSRFDSNFADRIGITLVFILPKN